MKHESNTFTPLTTDLDEFNPVTGDEVFSDPKWTDESATAGFVDEFEAANNKIVPTSFSSAIPSGIVEADAYQEISGRIVDGVRAADLDGVYLDLHGSMFVATEDDPEGDLVARVRRIVGEDIPIVVSLDLHATMTDRLVQAVDGFTAYRTAPHTDVYETGVRAARLLETIVSGDLSTEISCIRIPMLLAGEQSETDARPMSDLIRSLEDADRKPGILSSSILLGFPWADSPHNGVFALMVMDKDSEASAREKAEELAINIWERRNEFDFTTDAYPLVEALNRAETAPSPAIVADSGDNPTAGATEDLTLVVDQLQERGIENSLVAVIADPDARRMCADAGEDAIVSIELGRLGPETEEPLRTKVEIETITSTRGIEVSVVVANGVTTIVTSERMSVTDPDFLREVGVDPMSFDIIVTKTGYVSPDYQDLAGDVMLALTPGDTNELLTELPYEKVPSPIYPLDTEFAWSPFEK